ncbi:MAG: arabinose efflux permease family protein [Ilumatobacteraceae bacterium]|nr:arabinose efflux permease family protein [Ilumatobacteraceae bacterium]
MSATPDATPGAEPDADAGGVEELEDAYLEGDRTFEPGTARAAFSHRTFRIVYLGAFASNIGTWMQNVVLGALAWQMTKSGLYLGLVTAAQLGPLLLFSVVGGMIADSYDRKRSLLALCLQQAAFSLVLALVTVPSHPSEALLLVVVLIIGIGNALYAPIFSAVVPILVPRRDLPGAISLNSVQMNASRVIGPIIGAPIYAAFGPSWVFVLNAASFGFVLLALNRVTLPAPKPTGAQGLHRLLEGFQAARDNRVIGQCLIVIAVFSFWCLPWIPQMAAIADHNLDIDSKSAAFGILYGCFGFGAVLGALSIGTIFTSASKERLTRIGLVGFAGMILVFGTMHAAAPAFVAIIVLGAVYFAVITSLSTVLQQSLDDSVRGKVMALWIMGFGGMVPFGGIVGGIMIEQFGITPMIVVCSIVSLGLAWWADLLPTRPPGVLAREPAGARPLP